MGVVGNIEIKVKRKRFPTLISSIVSQQISVAAARTIQGRLNDLVAPEKMSAQTLIKYGADELRQVGLSKRKGPLRAGLGSESRLGKTQAQPAGAMFQRKSHRGADPSQRHWSLDRPDILDVQPGPTGCATHWAIWEFRSQFNDDTDFAKSPTQRRCKQLPNPGHLLKRLPACICGGLWKSTSSNRIMHELVLATRRYFPYNRQLRKAFPTTQEFD